MPPLRKFWHTIGSKKRKNILPKKNIKVDDETIKQFKELIKIYNIVQQTLGYEEDMLDRPFNNNPLSLLKETLKILEQNKTIEKDKEDTKTEFDVWFNSRK